MTRMYISSSSRPHGVRHGRKASGPNSGPGMTNNLNFKNKDQSAGYSWRESSWKKYFNAYLVDSHKYFVFPKGFPHHEFQ